MALILVIRASTVQGFWLLVNSKIKIVPTSGKEYCDTEPFSDYNFCYLLFTILCVFL